MAIWRPFAALRPVPAWAGRVCELPYDVVSTEEARAGAAGNPHSFFRVSKPEIEWDAGEEPDPAVVYARGRENLRRLVREGVLVREASAAFYLYRQVMGTHAQVGVVGLASCREYRDGMVRRHELTRPDKEDDRARHIEALDAQTGPAFLIQRVDRGFSAWLAERASAPPEVDFAAPDGVRHSAWAIRDADGVRRIEEAVGRQARLYIADGHHRTAAAARVAAARQGRGGSDGFLAVLFPDDAVQVLPYHRLVRDLNGHTPAGLLERLRGVFEVEAGTSAPPERPRELGLYLAGSWHRLRFRPEWTVAGTVAEGLDVALLQRHVLGPVLGIEDPRVSDRLQFVGGIRGTPELAARVDRGEAACAWALAATPLRELLAVAEAGEIMPPKSTWFEPKLRDGLFTHVFDEFVLS